MTLVAWAVSGLACSREANDRPADDGPRSEIANGKAAIEGASKPPEPEGARGSGADPRPDVLLISIDTLRADRVGAYGDPGARTPNFDRLAREGRQFERAFAVAPITLPSHATMLTGVEPPTHGLRDNGMGALPADVPTLAERLAAEGYDCAAFVSAAPLDARHGLDRGFRVYDDAFDARPGGAHSFPERDARATTAAALAWIRESRPRSRPDSQTARVGAPRFLFVHFFDPHAPYAPPPPFDESRSAYDGEVRHVDHRAGTLLEAFRSAAPGRVVVCLTADHGEGLGDHGEPSHAVFLYDTTLAVPWILLDGRGSRGTTPRETSSIDLVPTLLGAIGIAPRPASHPARGGAARRRGIDLSAPPAGAPPTEPTRLLYAESAYGYLQYGWAPLFSLRGGERKLVRAGDRDRWFDLSTDPGEHGRGQAMPRDDRREAWREHLADRSRPPGSTSSRAGGPDAKEIARLQLLGYAAGAGAGVAVPAADDASVADLPDPHHRRDVVTRMQDARALSNEGFSASAARALAELAETDPTNPTVALLHGLEMRKLARRVATDERRRELLLGARAELRRATDLRPAFTAARNGRAAVAMQLALLGEGDLTQAFELVRSTIDAGCADADTWFHLYLLRVDPASPVHDPEAAAAALGRCLEIDPEHAAGRRARALTPPVERPR